MKLSVVIPAHNEEGNIENTVRSLVGKLNSERIDHEIVVVNDNSRDRTEDILRRLKEEFSTLKYINNDPPNGFGFAVKKGLENFNGDAVCIFMADLSDSPEDVVKFFKKLQCGHDCVFGSRFKKGGKVVDYPTHKLILNRIFNTFVSLLFGIRYNDMTNAFKMYRTHVIQGLRPFLSHHFNLTVEMPLKAIIRGYTYFVVPNSWTNRTHGVSKLRIKEMGSRYFFIVLYCFIEKWLSCGDYQKVDVKEAEERKEFVG